jgi:hypothetical protein
VSVPVGSLQRFPAPKPARLSQKARRRLVGAGCLAALVVVGLLVTFGLALAQRYSDYGAFFPGRTPQRLTYCGGRHYLRGERPVTRAQAERAVGTLITVGHTPGGAALLAPKHLDVLVKPPICPTGVYVAATADTQLVTYTLSGGP